MENNLDTVDFKFIPGKRYVLFIRHGFSKANMFEGAFFHQLFRNYHQDAALTDTGFENAKELGKILKNILSKQNVHKTIYKKLFVV